MGVFVRSSKQDAAASPQPATVGETCKTNWATVPTSRHRRRWKANALKEGALASKLNLCPVPRAGFACRLEVATSCIVFRQRIEQTYLSQVC